MTIDVTDATFEAEVLERSRTTPVVIDLWAPWCGPCQQLGPILTDAVDATDGDVVLVKVNIDDNPAVANAFKVQSIPAVFAMKDAKVVDAFLGARPAGEVTAFVQKLRPTSSDRELAELLARGDESSLRRVLEITPDHVDATMALAELLIAAARREEALEMLGRIPETAEAKRIAALARVGPDEATGDDVSERLTGLLARVAEDDAARQEYLDVLELLGPDDPRTKRFRKELSAALF
ncbi:MAG TPA: tetratricopeptide repeat protein [Acidimicrobiales bacterium]|nr:tetratricopeptide repeat protein [Acidimicrobiales bacterium]